MGFERDVLYSDRDIVQGDYFIANIRVAVVSLFKKKKKKPDLL